MKEILRQHVICLVMSLLHSQLSDLETKLLKFSFYVGSRVRRLAYSNFIVLSWLKFLSVHAGLIIFSEIDIKQGKRKLVFIVLQP